MKTESIRVREARATEIAAIAEAMAESFRQYGGAFKQNPDWALETLRRDPGTTAAHTHVVTVDGRIASGLHVFERRLRAGAGVARAGCIGNVFTRPAWRGRGLIRKLLAFSHAWMARRKFDFAFLFGNPKVYGGSGYRIVPAWKATIHFESKCFDPIARQVRVRAVRWESDVSFLQTCYAFSNRGGWGGAVRNREYWSDWLRHRQTPHGSKWVPRFTICVVQIQGNTAGYFLVAPDRKTVVEVAARDQASWKPVLAAVARHALRQRKVALNFWSPEWERRWAAIFPRSEDLEKQSPLRIELAEQYGGMVRLLRRSPTFPHRVIGSDALADFLRAQGFLFWSGTDNF
ncbi:MAG: GNAT family N-acetyltransferase [Verrucomicrobia bacterium]|nr:GNAT family N-acetyltransferase [Verrucomicrobiota bacterium]